MTEKGEEINTSVQKSVSFSADQAEIFFSFIYEDPQYNTSTVQVLTFLFVCMGTHVLVSKNYFPKEHCVDYI